jgi:hypothetical protein
MSNEEPTQVTGLHYDYQRKPPQEVAVGLYKVSGKKRTVYVWAESDAEARKIATYAGMRGTRAEPVYVEQSNGHA